MGKGEGSGVDFAINGHHYNVDPADKVTGDTRLVDYIRDNAGLKGTKFMCREGGCGACVVTVRTKDPVTGKETTKAVNSCLTPVYSCEGWDISTVEHVGNKKQGYHTIQKRLAKFNGTQCGFCSPGFVMNMYSLLESKSEITMQDVEDSFDGNICRCTGYRPILDAFKSMAVDAPEELRKQCTGDIEDCANCPSRTESGSGPASCSGHVASGKPAKFACSMRKFLGKENGTNASENKFKLSSGETWIQANDIKSALTSLEQLKSGGKCRIVAGNTGAGVFKHDGPYTSYVDINGIQELKKWTLDTGVVILGGGVTLTSAIHLLKEASKLDGYAYAADMGKHIERVANVPVRNCGTLAGNLMLKHAHPEFQSDIFVVLETVGARMNIAASGGSTKLYSMTEFLALDMKAKLIVSINLPQRKEGYVYRSFKITKRYQNAHAYVNAGFLFKVDSANNYKVLEKPSIVYGGISADFSHAKATEDYLNGKNLGDETTLQGALAILDKEVTPDVRPSEGTVEYRKTLTKTLLYKTILGIVDSKTKSQVKSGKADIEKKMSKGQQTYDKVDSESALYQNITKIEGLRQVSGEAEFVSDLPQFRDELFAVHVSSTVANADLKNIDASEALKMPGVARFISADDIPGANQCMGHIGFFPTVMEEPIFGKGKVHYYGQPLGLILAESREIALAAAAKVVVTYENVEKPIVDIDTAINKLEKEGTTEKSLIAAIPSKDQPTEEPKNNAKGQFYVGSQYHFHMETHACVCIPKEDGIDVYATTQWKDHVIQTLSDVLNIPCNNINIYVRRLGGGFGAKICRTTQVAAACAVAATVSGRPVRIVLDMEKNMDMIGKRPNYLLKYDVGFDDTGKISKLHTEVFGDIGFGLNEPTPVVISMHLQGPYAAVGWVSKAYSVRTNTPSNTAVRAPGTPQAALLIETVMEHVAKSLGKDVLDVRAVNYMKPGDALVPTGLPFENENLIPMLIEEVKKSGEYEKRKKFIEEFNSENRWKKRGMGLVPVGYPVGHFGAKFPVQVVVYHKDGSIAVSHGGIEMGQGINTKVAQTVSHFLNVPIDKIQIKPSNSFSGANAFCSGGSIASELVCDGAMRACQLLNERMKPIKEKLDNPSWETLVDESYKQNVNLNAHYMHSPTDGIKPYHVWLVNLTEVEVDILTGEYKVVRTDLIEDAGKSLSPGVDIGQIEGGHIFGQGLYTTEKLVFDKNSGKLLTNNTWEYKPPESKDIPEDFRITLLKNAPNPHGVLGSKATGEPVVCGSCAVVFALKNAIAAARKDAGNEEWFNIDTPITPETVVNFSLTSAEHYKY